MLTAADLIRMTNTRSSETTPLISSHDAVRVDEASTREQVFAFLEAKSSAGRIYERFTMVLIVINVLAFVLATLFVEEYNPEPWAMRDGGICGKLCDALWFGNYKDNGLEFLQMGTTSILEVFTVFVFSIDYLCRIWTADLESERFEGFVGRLKYLPTFYSIVDLASTVPFYVDAFVLTHSDLVASQVRAGTYTLHTLRTAAMFSAQESKSALFFNSCFSILVFEIALTFRASCCHIVPSYVPSLPYDARRRTI